MFRKGRWILFHPDRWDTWYALAQTYTLESENALAWAADRIEKDRKTIARYQRVPTLPTWTLLTQEINIVFHDGGEFLCPRGILSQEYTAQETCRADVL